MGDYSKMGMRRVGYTQNDRRVGGASGKEGGREEGRKGGREAAVKTMIAFHQVRPIFYSSLKQSNLQKDNYALAPFYLLEGEQCQGLIAVALPASTSANYPLSALVRHHG